MQAVSLPLPLTWRYVHDEVTPAVLFGCIRELRKEVSTLRRSVDQLIAQNVRAEKTIETLARKLRSTESRKSTHNGRGLSRSRSRVRVAGARQEVTVEHPRGRSSSHDRASLLVQLGPQPRRPSAAPSREPRGRPTEKSLPKRVLRVAARDSPGPSTLPRSRLRICSELSFVSGQDPSLTAMAMYNHLTACGISVMKTRKIRAGKPHYSSFQMEIPDSDVDRMFDEYSWHPGSIIREFTGTLDEADVLDVFPRPRTA